MELTDIENAVVAAKKCGWLPDEDLSRELDALRTPHYRVFLAGKFQVGKSLLADQVYLGGGKLLKSGIGLPTTSVVTELAYGTSRVMRVIFKDGTPDEVVENPSDDDVARWTTAESEEERTGLTKRIDRVVLTIPEKNLETYSVLDSPGIDDANQEVMVNSTIPQIAKSDVVVLVVPPRTLDTKELDFLSGTLFEKSISRLMILISYNPNQSLGKKVRDELVATIKAQLDCAGRGYVPVSICCYDGATENALNNPDAIREAIHSFALENVGRGRIERVAGMLAESLSVFVNHLKARIAVNDQTDDEIKKLKKKLEDAEIKLSNKCNLARATVDSQTAEITCTLRSGLRIKVEGIKARFLARFENCPDLADVQNTLTNNQGVLMDEFKSFLTDETQTVKDRLTKVLTALAEELRTAVAEVRVALDVNYEINTGWLGKLNSKALTVADYVLTTFLSPFGALTDLLIRFLMGKIPFIKNILPTVFVKNRVIKTIHESVDEIGYKVCDDLMAQLDMCFRRIIEDVELQFKKIYEATILPLVEAIREKEAGKVPPSELSHCLEMIRLVEGHIATLNAE